MTRPLAETRLRQPGAHVSPLLGRGSGDEWLSSFPGYRRWER
jgi:hypothetical protein